MITLFLFLFCLLVTGHAAAQTTREQTMMLNWTDNSDNETHFIIYMRKADGSYEEIGRVGENVTTFQHIVTGAEGSNWCFAVTAAITTIESARSNDGCAQIAALAGVSITSKKTVLPSRRGGSGSSIVAVLLNANDNETNIVTDKQVLPSRRADDGSSIIPILVNADETVTINGVVQ